MSVKYAELRLDIIHKLIETATGLKIYADGQDVETVKTPFLMYTEIPGEDKYKEYQALTRTEYAAGVYTERVELPTKSDFQYSVHYTAAERREARNMIRKLYLYFCSPGFRLALDRAEHDSDLGKKIDSVGFTIISAIRTAAPIKGEFFERQYMFDVRWLWRDGMLTTGAETINTADDPIIVPVLSENDIS